MKVTIEIDSPKLKKVIKSDPKFLPSGDINGVLEAIIASQLGTQPMNFEEGGRPKFIGPEIMKESVVTLNVDMEDED